MILFTATDLAADCTMPVSRSYHDYVIDQMRKIRAVTSRAMFGGYVVYSDGVAFAILDDDRLYFKTDDNNRGDYQRAAMQPWDYRGDGRGSMSNFEVPEAVLEDPAELALWAKKAIAAAIAKKKQPGSKSKTKKSLRTVKKAVPQKKKSSVAKKRKASKRSSR